MSPAAEYVWGCKTCEKRFTTHHEAGQHAKGTRHLVTRLALNNPAWVEHNDGEAGGEHP